MDMTITMTNVCVCKRMLFVGVFVFSNAEGHS